MRIKDNPFFILGVTPVSTLEDIEDACESKSFMDEENEETYEKARSVLTHPQRRLEAEVRWFYSHPAIMTNNPSLWDFPNVGTLTNREIVFYGAEGIYGVNSQFFKECKDNNKLTSVVSEIIQAMDLAYMNALNPIDLHELIKEIENAREKADISPIQDINTVKSTLQESFNEDMTAAFEAMFKNNHLDKVALIIRDLVINKVKEDNKETGRNYHEVVRKLLDLYNIQSMNNLDELKAATNNEIEKAKTYTQVEQLSPLFAKIHQLEFYAEPLQLYFRDIGQADKQAQSREIATALRQLSLYYWNEKQLDQMSLAVAEEERKIFYALPEIAEQLDKDLAEMRAMQKTRDLYLAVKNIIDEINKVIIRKNGYENQNYKVISSNRSKWLNQLDASVSKLSTLNDVDIKHGNFILSQGYYTFATACTWGNCWDFALQLAQKALSFAQKSGNQEQISEIEKAIIYFQQTIRNLPRHESLTTSQNGFSKFGCFILVIIAIIGLFAYFGSDSMHKNGSSKNHSVVTTQKKSENSSSSKDDGTERKDGIEYKEPPIGHDRKFTIAEMHWAAREQIRLEVMKSLIKNRKGIVAYNKMVDNYNKRASSFKYRDNTWPMAKADVEKHRDEIVEDAKKEVHENGWDVDTESYSSTGYNDISSIPVPTGYGNPKMITQSPTDVFRRYHECITFVNYRNAWDCLSSDFQSQLNYDDWVAGYATTLESVPININVISNDGQSALLSFRLRATDNLNGNNVTTYYTGKCALINTDDGWKIDSIEASRV